MAEEPIELPIEIVVDASGEASARAAGEAIGGSAAEGAQRGFQERLGRGGFEGILARLGPKVGDEFYRQIGRGAEDAGRAFSSASARVREMNEDVDALNRRVAAMRRQLESAGADPDLFAVIDRELNKVLSTARSFQDNFERIVADPDRLKTFETSLTNSTRIIFREMGSLQSVLKATDRERTRAANQALATEQAAARAVEGELRRAHGRYIAETQSAAAQRLAETRIAGQRQVQEERSIQRRRIELLRFTLNQVRQIERAISSVFRASAVVLSGAYARIERTVVRFGRVLTRTDRQMNAGLAGALNARERAMSGSFRRQTDIVSRETSRQEQLLADFHRRQRGLLGILGGRGGLGLGAALAAVTGGLGIGQLFRIGAERFNEMQRLNLLLTRITGSATAGARALGMFDEVARRTPFALTDVANLGVGLLSIGQTARQATRSVQALLDAVGFVGGGAEELQRVSLAIRQIQSAGRLLGQDFNQLAQALPGLNLTRLLADQLFEGDTAALLKARQAGTITAEQFTRALIEGIENDPRITGAAEALSDTLAGQASKLRTAFARLGAAIIGEQEQNLRRLMGTLRDGMDQLTRFVRGDVTPTMLALRAALLGIARAIGVLAGLRAAVEVFGLLGLGARALLTPMGALVGIFAAVGAAIGVLSQVSPRFAAAMETLQRAFGSLLSGGVGGFVDRLGELAQILAERLGPIIERVADFLRAQWPLVLRLAGAGVTFLTAALNGLLDVVRGVVGFLAPAIDGFRALAASVREAFSGGGFGALRSGLEAFASGVVEVFRNLGSLLVDQLRPPVERLLSTIWDALTRLPEFIATSVGDAVQSLGFIVGRVLSDRRFLGALEVIAALAVLLGVRFAIGFAEGVASQLPATLSALGRQIDALAGLLWSNLIDPQMFARILGAAVAGGVIYSTLRQFFTQPATRAGADAGQGFARSFMANVSGTLRTLGRGEGFFGVLFGGSGRFQDIARRQAQQVAQERINAERQLALLGRGGPLLVGGAAVNEMQALQRELGVTTIRAATLRASFDQLRAQGVGSFRAIVGAVRETNQLMGGGTLRAIGVQAGAALGSGVIAGFSAFVSGQQGGASGLIGVLASALIPLSMGHPIIAGAVVGIGAIATVLGESKRASAEAAAGMREYAEDVIRATNASEGFVAQTNRLISEIQRALPTDLQDLLIDADFDASAFTEAARAGATLEEALRASTNRSSELTQVFAALGTTGLDTLSDIIEGTRGTSIAAGDARKIVELLAAEYEQLVRAGEFERINSGLRENAGLAGRTADQIERINNALAQGQGANIGSGIMWAPPDVLNQLSDAGRDIGLFFDNVGAYARQVFGEIPGWLEDALANFELEVDPVQAVVEAIERLNVTRTEQLHDRLDTVNEQLAEARTRADAAREAVRALLDGNYGGSAQEAVDNFVRSLPQIAERLSSALELTPTLRRLELDAIGRDIRNALGEALTLGFIEEGTITSMEQFIDVLERAGLNGALGELAGGLDAAQSASRGAKDHIDRLSRSLEAARAEAAEARSALENFLNGSYGTSAARQLDQFIVGLDGWRERLEQISGRIARDPLGLEGLAQQRLAIAEFGDEFGRVLSAAQQEGLVFDAASARRFFGPAFDTVADMLAGATDRAMRLGIVRANGEIGEELGDLADLLEQTLGRADLSGALQRAANADAMVNSLQAQLDAARLETEVNQLNVTPEALALLNEQIQSFFDDNAIAPALNDARIAEEAHAAVDRLSRDLALEIKANVIFSPAQVYAELRRMGLSDEAINLISPGLISGAQVERNPEGTPGAFDANAIAEINRMYAEALAREQARQAAQGSQPISITVEAPTTVVGARDPIPTGAEVVSSQNARTAGALRQAVSQLFNRS